MVNRKMNILVVGNDGATHALLRELSRSQFVKKLFCFPGKEGFKNISKVELVDVGEDLIYNFAKEHEVDLVIIRSENDLVKGMSDRFREIGILVYGPEKKDTWLEADKGKAREFMACHGIPTPKFFIANNPEEAYGAIDEIGDDVVVKAAYLAKGKGVGVFSDKNEAKEYAKWLLEGGLDGAGKKLVIEERLFGYEVSVILSSWGKGYNILPIVQDHKQVYDGDKGPNTGGTGVYGPVDLPSQVKKKIREEIINPTLAGLRREGIDYRGILYLGIMVTVGPDSQVSVWLLEFNIRLGDPESEAQMLLLADDGLAMFMYNAAIGKSYKKKIAVRKGYCICVVVMAENYPGKPIVGDIITGLESIEEDENHAVFHANTIFENGMWKTAGGRVLVFSVFAETLEKAIEEVYKMVKKVHFFGMHYRRDIGQKGLKKD